ncbi:MAG: UPF0149 family protein [Candidatus Accumulibacter phosphatis]|jgi:uncharacterized protein|uniref:YecA/YgfB family protein n=1 Tax=Candidatus Accumulibacter sp. ACC012 TaxID=2823332 RepID=UPI0025BB9C5D|nr:UPF0149 family protein [Candidatus Accumulibacter sp. ACC012]
MSLPATLADPQLLRLEQLLGDPALPETMQLDEAHGFLCAALAGPQPMAEEQWLSEILGKPQAGREDLLRETAELLRPFVAALEAELASGEPPLLLLYPIDGDKNSAGDYIPWCEGYLQGVDAASEDWFDALGADDEKEDSDEISYLDELLFPLFLLTGDAGTAALDAGEEWPSGEELDRLEAECEEKLPQVVSAIYRFWVAQRSIKTIRREAPKIGRNDPCPCGSGKKFKKCCGA